MLCSTLCSENAPVEIPTNNMPLLPGVWSGGGSPDREVAFVVTDGAVVDEFLWAYTATEALEFPANLEGSEGQATATPAINADLRLYVDGVEVGQIIITANVVTFSSAGFALAAGQTVMLQNKTATELIFEIISVSLKATVPQT